MNRVKAKVIVLTGATSGIGYYTALDLAKKGEGKLYFEIWNIFLVQINNYYNLLEGNYTFMGVL